MLYIDRSWNPPLREIHLASLRIISKDLQQRLRAACHSWDIACLDAQLTMQRLRQNHQLDVSWQKIWLDLRLPPKLGNVDQF